MKNKIFIGLGILAVIIILLMATGALKFKASIPPSDQPAAKESALPEGWIMYTSGEFGYSLAYPDGWNLKEENNGGSRDVLIVAPGEKAFVRIVGLKDGSVNSVTAVEASMANYKASFTDKPNEELKEFESQMQGEIGGFMASGRMKVNEATYQFLERGLLATNGRILIMRGAVNTSETSLTQEEFDAYVKMVKRIMDSFSVK